MERKNLVFTEAEANAAADDWNFNCGPAALCAVLDMTPAQLRPHLIDFEQKGYTNPSLMFAVLNNLKIDHRQFYRGDIPSPTLDSDRIPHAMISPNEPGYRLSLARIQWGGPWTKPGVHMGARYRQTHWVASRVVDLCSLEIFDVNAMGDGGWLPFRTWSDKLIPWLIKECVPKADGTWWPTHGISITPKTP